MERIMSQEERIKRAEEIYYKRRNIGTRVNALSVNNRSKNKISLPKKMIIQLVICVVIYSAFWGIRNGENDFCKNTVETVSSMLSYDVNFSEMYNWCYGYINQYLVELNKDEKADSGVVANEEENIKDTSNDNAVNLNEEGQTDISGADNSSNSEEGEKIESPKDEGGMENENNLTLESENVTDSTNIDSQMQSDAEYIRQNYSFIKPVQGYVTSGFGHREPTEIISEFHQGADIGAEQGTPVYSAIDGKVITSSYVGDYGNCVKIQNGEVLTVYAHCSELHVSVGDEVSQNQLIAKVGATRKGNGSTFTL